MYNISGIHSKEKPPLILTVAQTCNELKFKCHKVSKKVAVVKYSVALLYVYMYLDTDAVFLNFISSFWFNSQIQERKRDKKHEFDLVHFNKFKVAHFAM